MRDDKLWAAVTQLFNGSSTPTELKRGSEIGAGVAEIYKSIYAGVVQAEQHQQPGKTSALPAAEPSSIAQMAANLRKARGLPAEEVTIGGIAENQSKASPSPTAVPSAGIARGVEGQKPTLVAPKVEPAPVRNVEKVSPASPEPKFEPTPVGNVESQKPAPAPPKVNSTPVGNVDSYAPASPALEVPPTPLAM